LLRIRKGRGLTFEDDDLLFGSIVVLILVAIIDPSPFRGPAMGKLLTDSRDSIPVAAFACIVAGGASFGIRLGVTAGFGAERAAVTLGEPGS
jgi:hypothetical protein